MKTISKFGLGALVLVMGASLLAMRPHRAEPAIAQSPPPTSSSRRCRPASRRDVDYELLDARLQQLMPKPAMVGMAVGIVENGRITFLKGYGETLEGSGDPVTPETVFRWASMSKGVAATMVAKLAEQGKIDLGAPVAELCAGPQAAGRQRISRHASATCCRTASGSIANAYDNKLEEGQDPSFLRSQLGAAQRRLRAGHLLVVPERRLRCVERDGHRAITHMPYEQAVKR